MRTKNYVERNGKVYARKCYRDSTGKKRQIWRRVETKTQAKEKAGKLTEELNQFGVESFEHDLTLGEYLDRWLKSVKNKVSEHTAGDYEAVLKRHVRPLLETRRLSKLRPLDFQSVVDNLNEQGFAPRTVKYVHTVLSSAIKQAVRWRLLTSNPAQYVELPKSIRREMQCLSVEQAKAFLKESAKDEFGLLFEFAIVTGMRPEEYLALKWDDIQDGVVSIQRVLIRRSGGGWYFTEPKTKNSRRSVPLPEYLLAKLKHHRAVQSAYRLKQGDKYKNHNLVFPSRSGTPMSIRNLDRRHFKPILERANLPKIRLYDCRHTCATLLLAAGENPKIVAERLGHSKISMTLDVYSHVLPTMQKSATEKISTLLGN
jgi:integrase